MPTRYSLFKRFLMHLSLLFPRPVWPAVLPVLRCSTVDYESCKGRESECDSWLAWGSFPFNTKSTDNVKCLKSYPAKCPIRKLNFALKRTLSPSCTHGRHWLIVIAEDRGACSCFLWNLCHHFTAAQIITRVLNIISIRIKEAKSPIHLSKYLFELVAYENPFKFKLQR